MNTTSMNTIPSLILDTDIDGDCDDASALAVLHALADLGECNILGVVVSAPPVDLGVGAVRAINHACGRPDLPVGAPSIMPDDPSWESYREHIRLLSEGLIEGFSLSLMLLSPHRDCHKRPPSMQLRFIEAYLLTHPTAQSRSASSAP
jgi:hypothetical protein